jgi:hypothetical protein
MAAYEFDRCSCPAPLPGKVARGVARHAGNVVTLIATLPVGGGTAQFDLGPVEFDHEKQDLLTRPQCPNSPDPGLLCRATP